MGVQRGCYLETPCTTPGLKDIIELHADDFNLVSGYLSCGTSNTEIIPSTSMDWAEASMRNLTSLVQEVLKTNVNMASRLKDLERMHPALAASLCTSRNDSAASEGTESRAVSRRTLYKFTFEEELETSPVYKRAGPNQIRISKSSTASNGPSCLSGLSLSDVSNVSAIALPISSMELWNHHRYRPANAGSATTATSLDEWYNPSAKVHKAGLSPIARPEH